MPATINNYYCDYYDDYYDYCYDYDYDELRAMNYELHIDPDESPACPLALGTHHVFSFCKRHAHDSPRI